MNLFLQLIALVSLQQISLVVNGQSYVLTSSCGGVVTEGSSCVLTCETSAVTETFITWRMGKTLPYEVNRTTCTTSIPSVPSDYDLACPGTSFTLTITAASVTRDKTTWKCDAVLGGNESNIINFDVQDISTSSSTQDGSKVASATLKQHLRYLSILIAILLPTIIVVLIVLSMR